MKIPRLFPACLIPPLTCLMFTAVVAAQAPTPTPPGEKEAGLQELTRGPVHEAFGQPAQFNPEPGEVVPKAPPEAVEELPPDQKPEGDDVRWIPGYWQWDDETKDFLWVSGFWRNIPPGRSWVPGYWNKTAEGQQWVSGFWASSEASDVEYLPAPPESLEAGPVGEAPAADSVWSSGTWVWRDTRYLWQPGYWTAGNADWVWSSPHYEWTPHGHVFVNGYWDYPIDRRGLLFAPVIFGNTLRPGYVYTPSVFINPALLAANLFARPRYQHYYFGDYYAPNYVTSGIYPWFAFHNTRRGYDPLYAHTDWAYGRTNPNWEAGLRQAYWNRREQANTRPPRTFAAQRELARTSNATATQNLLLARSLADNATARDLSVRLAKVEASQTKIQQQRAAEFRQLANDRVKWEQGTAGRGAPAKRDTPARVKLPASVSAGASTSVSAKAPPALPKQPEAAPRAPAAPKAARLPQPEDVLRRDFNRGGATGNEPTPKGPVTPKNPLPKEPVTPKNPLPKEPVTPKNPLPKEPMVPKNPLPKEPVVPKNPLPKEPMVPKNPLPKEPLLPKTPPAVNPPVPKTPPAVNPPIPKVPPAVNPPAPKPKGNPKDKD